MKIALVHDYLREFGGAERVLKVLSEMYPKAPIYTAFADKNSTAGREFLGSDIRESKFAPLLKLGKLYSPLRFLAPLVWKSFDLSQYDIVITSASWFITRGFKVGPKTKVICYCHTPPRWLYGYETSVGFTKYWPVKMYAAIVGHFMRMYDWDSAQTVDYWIANSENVRKRIEKFYRKNATVIYPPIDVKRIEQIADTLPKENLPAQAGYFLIVSRLVGAKGLEEAAAAFKGSVFTLKIVGEAAGFSEVYEHLKKLSGGNIELVGRVSDEELYKLYAKAKGFIALARDEDFGMTVVEAQAAGTPVIAFNGGGFKESVVDGKTGFLISATDVRTIKTAVSQCAKKRWSKKELQKNAERFSKEQFVQSIRKSVESVAVNS